MKKSLLALALFAVTGTTAFAHTGPGKDAKATKKECTKGGDACCMKKGTKTAAVKPAEKAPTTAKM
ncbi:hypothetical protein [Hymenobacter rubidus]|uniref:hypothetical protein n=1 Tax=Hymenobacter rubidus TaxID=1441626 RepID=UPI00191F26F2|nr:hypothetical protein [Hymenobacter rubidus]